MNNQIVTVNLIPGLSAPAVVRVSQYDYGRPIIFNILTAHTSQSTWIPSDSPSLWARVDDPSIEFPEWMQPVGSTDSYPLGAKVSHISKHWISDVDDNVWEPGVYGWSEVI